jgi:hypothetical protein
MFARYQSPQSVVAIAYLCLLSGLLSFLPARVQAQETRQVVVGPGPQLGLGPGNVAWQEKIEVVKGHPYQADAVTETIQTLADGSHITQKITAHVARDAEGRTMRSQSLTAFGPWAAANNKQMTLVSIFDPVAGQHIDYSSDSKSAHALPMPTGNQLSGMNAVSVSGMASGGGVVMSTGLPPPGAAGGLVVSGATMLAQPASADSPSFARPNETTESLGSQTVEGLTADGSRTKDVVPAGTIGNEKDLVSTRETWYSSELKIVLSSIRNDPRFGEVRYSLTNIQVSAPDPSLFQVPPGYTVEHVPVHIETR